MDRPKILGILNLTADSFSDGGKYLDPDKAYRQALHLLDSGADILDLGAQSSNIASAPVPVDLEWERLRVVWEKLWEDSRKLSHPKNLEALSPADHQSQNLSISLDSFRPYILEKALEFDGGQKGLAYWNDITALKDSRLREILSSYYARSSADLKNQNRLQLILMYSHNREDRAVAESHLTPGNAMDEILGFFDKERKIWTESGIPESAIIYDPGMGFFLGGKPEVSFSVLKQIPRLKKELGRVLVSVSRKSFLGNALGGLPPERRDYASLAAEVFSWQAGVDYIRTHEPRPTLEAGKIYQMLRE